MSRLVRLTPGYARSAQRLGVRPGTEIGLKVARVIRALAGARALPEPGDIEGLIPPSLPAFVRRVDGAALWLWYTASPDTLTLRALTGAPP